MFDMTDTRMPGSPSIANVRCPALVMGVTSDILFPIDQQREIVRLLGQGSNPPVAYYELDAKYGHDTFLIDVTGVSTALRGFLK
jgi:homoserine acetyltransferase